MVVNGCNYGTWMSYLWHLDGYLWHLGLETWWVRDFGTRGLEHEIFWTRDFLNTNRTNNTNLFGTRISRISRILPTALWTQDFLNTNNTNNTNIILHTDLTDLGFLAFGSLWMTTRWVIDLLWLLTCCGYWLVMVIDLLWFKWQIKKDIREPCEALADPWDLWDPCA